jgi:ABC-type transport system substrate-binding protein
MGSYAFAYDSLSGGKALRVNAAALRVPTSNLVYLGMNAGRGALQEPKLRAALAACINKATLLGEAFHGYADVTDTPFPPNWFGLTAEDFAQPYDAAAARKALEALGYKELQNGVRASRYRRLSFTLVANQDSATNLAAVKAVKAQLAACQMEVNVQALGKEAYQRAVKTGAFDLYVGEIRLTPDCGLSPLLLAGGAATGGIQVWGKAASAYGQLLQGLISPAKFVSIFQEEMPFLPLGYRSGMAVAARSLHVTQNILQGNLFQDLPRWHF